MLGVIRFIGMVFVAAVTWKAVDRHYDTMEATAVDSARKLKDALKCKKAELTM